MDLRQLEYFVAVAEERSFTRAAARVHISQSGVSAQIRQLEREVGAVLLHRAARGTTLTEAGAAAIEHARAALAAAAAFTDAVDGVRRLLRGNLRAGMVTGCTVAGWFDALAEVRRAHPGVALSVREGRSDALVAEVRAGTLDVALVGIAASVSGELPVLPLVSEGLVTVVPSTHPLAARPEVTIDDLRDHPVVCMPAGSGIRAVLDRACAARGLRPTISVEANAAEAIVDLAARGLGVAILSESMAHPPRQRMVARPIVDIDEPALLAVVWNPAPSPAALALLAAVRRAFPLPAPP